MDEIERRVLDECLAEFELPPTPESERVIRNTFTFAGRMLAERLGAFVEAFRKSAAVVDSPSNPGVDSTHD